MRLAQIVSGRLKKPGLITGAVLGLAVGGVGSMAVMAAIPDSAGVIHGCYNAQGRLSVIDTGTTPPGACGNNETALNWNQQGPKGDTGATGPAGPAGPGGSGQTIAGVVNVPVNGATGQVVLSIPNLGSYRVTQCDPTSNSLIMYENDTDHDVRFGAQIMTPGMQHSTIAYTNRPGLLSYTSGVTTYTATVTQSIGVDEVLGCYAVAQATLSQIN